MNAPEPLRVLKALKVNALIPLGGAVSYQLGFTLPFLFTQSIPHGCLCRARCPNNPGNGGGADAASGGDFTGRRSCLGQGQDLIPVCNHLGAAADPSGLPGLLQAGHGSLTESHALLLGNHCQNGQHGVLEDPARVQVLFREGPIANAVSGEPLQVLKSFEDSLTAEAVQTPEQDAIKLALRCVHKQALELFAVGVLAGCPVDVFASDRPALLCGEVSKLGQLVLSVLAFVLRRNPSVKSNLHVRSVS